MSPKFPEVKNDPKVDYLRQQDREREKLVKADIREIDAALEKNDTKELVTSHRTLDGKYQACIIDWGQSMYGFMPDLGFDYSALDIDSIKDNLQLMRAKLETFMRGWNEKTTQTYSSTRTPDVNVTLLNSINISLFAETRQQIENMTALNQEQTDEILQRIDELEKIAQESTSRKSKWEKVNPIIKFALDKGVDVAIAILSLVLQIMLG